MLVSLLAAPQPIYNFYRNTRILSQSSQSTILLSDADLVLIDLE